MEDLFLTILFILGGVVAFQHRRISNLKSQITDVKDENLKVQQKDIQAKKEEIKQELVKVEAKKVVIDKEQSAEDYWKDKL